MKEDIEFLKKLQEELKTQDHDIQAAPRFWVVGDYTYEVRPEGCGDKITIYDPNDSEDLELEEVRERLLEIKEDAEETNYIDYSEIDRLSLEEIDIENLNIEKLLDLYQSIVSPDSRLCFSEKVHKIHPNTMFLTKQGCIDHIKANHYHYSSEVHTYAMTAWRAPKVERLLNILENFDWEQIEKILHFKEKVHIKIDGEWINIFDFVGGNNG